MEFIEKEKFNILKAEEGKQIRDINDIYLEEHLDENRVLIPEYLPHYTDEIYLPKQITFEQAKKLYIEEDK